MGEREHDFELLKLPSELVLLIASKVPCEGLVSLSATCKSLRKIVNDPALDTRYASSHFRSGCLGDTLKT